MRKVIAYELVRTENVMKYINQGWELYGDPYYSEYEGDVQVMVKYDNP